jgi:hypothetical protein
MCARHAGELAAKLKAEAVGVGGEGYGPLNLPAYSNRSLLKPITSKLRHQYAYP